MRGKLVIGVVQWLLLCGCSINTACASETEFVLPLEEELVTIPLLPKEYTVSLEAIRHDDAIENSKGVLLSMQFADGNGDDQSVLDLFVVNSNDALKGESEKVIGACVALSEENCTLTSMSDTKMKKLEWIRLKFSQYIDNSTYIAKMEVNEEIMFQVENKKPREFKNVRVYAGQENRPINGRIQKLQINFDDTAKPNVTSNNDAPVVGVDNVVLECDKEVPIEEPTYEWYKDGQLISQEVESSFQIPDNSEASTGNYSCSVVMALAGSSASDSLMVKFSYKPTVTLDGILGISAVTTMTCNTAANDDNNVTSYQWFREGQSVEETKPVQTLLNSKSVEGVYTCRYTTRYGESLLSDPKEAIFTYKPTVVTSSATAVEGVTNITLTCKKAATDGRNVTSYEWFEGGEKIGGESASTYTLAGSRDDSGSYRCKYTTIENSVNRVSVQSDERNVIYLYNDKPTITSNKNSPVAGKDNVSLTCKEATNEAKPTAYKWYLNGDVISGATEATYRIPNDDSSGNYTCEVVGTADGVGSETSNVLTVTFFLSKPTVTSSAATPIKGITNVTLTCRKDTSIEGNITTSHEWFKGGRKISGANKATYSLPGNTKDDTGSYTCKYASSNKVSEPSDGKSIIFLYNDKPTITTNKNLPVAGKDNVSLTCEEATNEAKPTYKWYFNGDVISGATEATYRIPNDDSGGNYTCEVVGTADGVGSETSNVLTVTFFLATTTPALPSTTTPTCEEDSYYSGTTNRCVGIVKMFKSELKMQKTFTRALRNSSSQAFKSLAMEVETSLLSELRRKLTNMEAVKVTAFKNGSIIAEYNMIFIKAAAVALESSDIEVVVREMIASGNISALHVNVSYLPVVHDSDDLTSREMVEGVAGALIAGVCVAVVLVLAVVGLCALYGWRRNESQRPRNPPPQVGRPVDLPAHPNDTKL